MASTSGETSALTLPTHVAMVARSFTRVDAELPIQREMTAVFADKNMRRHARSSLAALDRQRWHGALHHALAAPARERRADVPNHLEMAGM